MDADRNLLFGVLALQADLIDSRQFIEACTLWTARKGPSLADLLVEHRWILPADRDHVEYLLQRKLDKQVGLARTLAGIPDEIKRSLAALGHPDIERSLADLPRRDSSGVVTGEYKADSHERYSLGQLHATGGIGRIWLAHDNDIGRDVALKELRPERADDSTLRTRFLKEAQITGQLEHPGIVPVYELLLDPATQHAFYTMRYVKGRTMSEAARAYHKERLQGRDNSLGLLGLLNAFVTVCNTVAYAHSRGVIHRDLKGQNVILGDFGEVVVLDWGLAKLIGQPDADAQIGPVTIEQAQATEANLTVPGSALGTPAYMAPEQAAGRSDLVDLRTDVHGLGAILYEILTGQPPFTGSDAAEILQKVREQEPKAPRHIWQDVPPAVEAACLRALAKEPARRYGSAKDLAHDVQQWQEAQRKEAEERYRELFENANDMVYTTDLDLNVTSLNRSGERLTGYSQAEACTMNARQLLANPELGIQMMERKLKEGGGETRYDVVFLTKDGRHLPMELSSRLIFKSRKPVGSQGIARDITERKRLEEALARTTAELRRVEEHLRRITEG